MENVNRYQRFFEMKDIKKMIDSDDVDMLLEKNGVLYNNEEELDYQEQHASNIEEEELWDYEQ